VTERSLVLVRKGGARKEGTILIAGNQGGARGGEAAPGARGVRRWPAMPNATLQRQRTEE
jgi:hypothetical protein